MRKVLVLALVFLMPWICFAQFKTKAAPRNIGTDLRNPSGVGLGLVGMLGLDPSRFHMSQSYQMGFASIGGKSFTQGMYLNTMTYQFSIPLLVSVQWGIANQPFSGFGTSPLMQNGLFLSGAQLIYQPTKNMSIELEYRQIPYRYPYGMYHRNRFFDEW